MTASARLAALLGALAILVGDPGGASAQQCVGGLSKVEYPNGFSNTDFFNMTNVSIVNPEPNAAILTVGPAGLLESKLISTEIPNAGAGDYSIGKLLFHVTASFPAPCPGSATIGGSDSTRIDITYSLDNGVSWFAVNFPSGTTTDGTVLIDNLALGVYGNRLKWRATLLTSTNGCQPRLTGLSLGYQGIFKGTVQSTEPIPAGNVMVRASYEMPSSSMTDRAPRGHLQAKVLYSLDTVPLTDYTDTLHTPPNAWPVGDAGATITWSAPVANGSGPDARTIYFYNEDTSTTQLFTPANAEWDVLIPNSVRGLRYLGQLIYDMDGNNTGNDTDAQWLLQWIRGWANGVTKTQPKEWGLGAITRSTPAVVGPPGDPWWLSLSGTPSAERTLFGIPCGDAPEPAPPPAPVAPAVPANPTYLQQRRFRDSLVVVGSRDGLIHAFDFGKFRWCDDQSTAVVETRGWFSYRGARNYGDGHEVWAFAPRSMVGIYRRQPQRTRAWTVAQGLPMANVDAPINVADVCLGPGGPANPPPGGNPNCTFRTVMVAAETRDNPFVTAIDYVDPSIAPKALWSEDWPPSSENDTTFNGTETGVSIGPVATRNGGGGWSRRWEAATTSGMASVPTDLFLYLIDLTTGRTYNNGGTRNGFGRVKLNVNGTNANCSGQINGAAGPPVMVDSDTDGIVDRVYVTDTKGCVYKVETSTMNVCVLASLGETVYAPMAVRVADDISSRVELFVGGGDNPENIDIPANAQYHLFALEDDDLPGFCTPPKMLFSVPLNPAAAPGGVVHKLWSAPAVANDAVYVATAVGEINDACGGDLANPGVLEGWELTPSVQAGPRMALSPVLLTGNAVGGVRIYDGHLFANTANGSTTVFGRPGSWATSVTSVNPNGGTLLSTPRWQER